MSADESRNANVGQSAPVDLTLRNPADNNTRDHAAARTEGHVIQAEQTAQGEPPLAPPAPCSPTPRLSAPSLEVRARRHPRDRRQPGRAVRPGRLPRGPLPGLGGARVAGLDAQQLPADRAVGVPRPRHAGPRPVALPDVQPAQHGDAGRPPAGAVPADRSSAGCTTCLELRGDRPDLRDPLSRGRQLDLGRPRPPRPAPDRGLVPVRRPRRGPAHLDRQPAGARRVQRRSQGRPRHRHPPPVHRRPARACASPTGATQTG